MKYFTQNKHTLQIEEVSLRKFVLPILGIILLFMTIGAGISVKVIKEEIPVIYREKVLKFSPEAIDIKIKSLNLPHKEIIKAQILLETGGYTSQVFKLNNNLIGMKYAPSRINLQEGEDMGFARYASW